VIWYSNWLCSSAPQLVWAGLGGRWVAGYAGDVDEATGGESLIQSYFFLTYAQSLLLDPSIRAFYPFIIASSFAFNRSFP
jgi:hypothetical protein